MKTALSFTKMEGAGNDFIVIDNRSLNISLEKIIEITPRLCDRKYGIGADGILVLAKPQIPDADFTMIYRNADGSDAGMCGNGGRCLALFAAQNGFKTDHHFNVHENLYKAEVKKDEVSIHFPVTVIPKVLMIAEQKFIQANAATEHLVKFVEKEELQDEPSLITTGREIRMNPAVNPPGTNVNFVCFDNENHISVQTYERGVENLTLACGTGALASAIAAHQHKKSEGEHAQVKVKMKGGELTATFDFDPKTNTYYNLILTGPANFVFEGSITV